jgi:hypothetical protein
LLLFPNPARRWTAKKKRCRACPLSSQVGTKVESNIQPWKDGYRTLHSPLLAQPQYE